MQIPREVRQALTRRAFLGRSAAGIGGIALASLLQGGLRAAGPSATGAVATPHVAPRARRVIFLFMSGGPSHIDLFDPKPKLRAMQGQELPPSVRGQERFSANTVRQGSMPLVGSAFGFVRQGRS